MAINNCILRFFAILSMLSWTQVIGLQSSVLVAAEDSSPRLVQRAPFDNTYYAAKGGEWACSNKQLKIISAAVAKAADIARQTIQVLQKPDAEKSEAYRTWFGSSNANVARKTMIIDRHYRTVLENLGVPSIPVTVDWSREPKYQVIGRKPPVTTDSVVYACPDERLHNRGICNDAIAFVLSAKPDAPSPVDTTMLCFCPVFFSSKLNTKAKMEYQWRRESNAELSRGMALLHEVQHILTATRAGEKAEDLAYHAQDCKALPDASKIQNANNYALFALDISVYPRKGMAS